MHVIQLFTLISSCRTASQHPGQACGVRPVAGNRQQLENKALREEVRPRCSESRGHLADIRAAAACFKRTVSGTALLVTLPLVAGTYTMSDRARREFRHHVSFVYKVHMHGDRVVTVSRPGRGSRTPHSLLCLILTMK